MISWELTLGNVLNISTIAVGCILFIMTMKGKLDLLNQNLHTIDKRLTAVEGLIASLSQATIQLAKQEVRLDAIAREIEELKKR